MSRFAVLLVFLSLAGCSDGPVRQERPVPTDRAERAALRVNAGETGQTFEGDAYFGRVPEKNAVFIAFDGGEGGQAPDRVIDQVYVLQSEAESPGVLPGKVAGVQLLYARNSVLVRPSNGGAPVRFTVAGKESVGAAGARPLDWSGYGLARRTGQWPLVDGVPLQEALKTPLAASCGAASGGAQLMGSCDSGGAGSTSCSTPCTIAGGSCSVNCGAGYFSCCTKAACTCTCEKALLPDPGNG